ncbi:MAG: phage portal protein, partial [Agathobaculum butyriciproducens]
YKEIAAENGRDWKQQIDDNLEVIEYAKKKGYDLGGVIFDGKLGSEKEEEPKPEPPKPDDQTGDGQEEGTNDDDKGTQSGNGEEDQSTSDEGQE